MFALELAVQADSLLYHLSITACVPVIGAIPLFWSAATSLPAHTVIIECTGYEQQLSDCTNTAVPDNCSRSENLTAAAVVCQGRSVGK